MRKVVFQFPFMSILFIVLYLPRINAEVQAALKLMVPIINTKYYILCEIQLSSSPDDEQFYNHPVLIQNEYLSCKVQDWRYCNKPPPTQTHGVCGCSSKKKSSAGVLYYTFYFLIDPVTDAFTSSEFTCELSTAKDTRQMEIVTFTSKPDETVYSCLNASVHFNWDFKPVREIIRNRFKVTQISWKALRTTGINIQFLGHYYMPDNADPYFNNNGNSRTVVTVGNTSLPQLTLKSVQPSDSKLTIRINVTFSINLDKARTKKDNEGNPFDAGPTEEPEVTNPVDPTDDVDELYEVYDTDPPDIPLDEFNNPLGVNTPSKPKVTTSGHLIEETGNITTTTTTATTTKTKPTIKSTPSTVATIQQVPAANQISTTPGPLDFELDMPASSLIDSVQLSVAVPPTNDAKVSIKAYESLTGNLVVTCQVTFTFTGDPPVNVTIWHDNRLLITRPIIKTLHYSTQKEGNVLSCGLEGPALSCLPLTDNRRERVFFDLKDLTKTKGPMIGVDLLLSLYAWESIICSILILWTVSLFLDHLKFVLNKSRASLIKSNREILDKEKSKFDPANISE